ncbi:RNA polymerase sigma-70 factor (ECF subfamily) [Pedobacter sp. AK017]|uniref:RNA polymerase sigma factor n=1 Tax=Pedobacter sp. AK017 TaxID=2723073 RepID=UPI00161D2CF1|nr:RNA polymerase sigma-70 factor [Pedobacter sp. AK017]MBB5441312.1 RNA polymerase sigma-70 factor (ECF subfamily) [Pedobacter sp. AK017]
MSAYSTYTDQELTAFLKGGDGMAYTEIYNRFWAVLFRHARKMLYDDNEAADVIQDVFTTLWQKAPDLVINTSLSAYLYTTVRHKIFTLITRSKLKAAHLNSLADFIEQGISSTDEYIQLKELAESIETEINSLPKKMREIFELSRREELSYQEIADKLDITDHTVRKQMSNALKILKAKIHLFFTLALLINTEEQLPENYLTFFSDKSYTNLTLVSHNHISNNVSRYERPTSGTTDPKIYKWPM